MDTEEEDILVAIYINLINMVNAYTNLQIDLSFLQEIITSKKDIGNILLLQTALLANINTNLLKGNRLLDMTPEGARPATLLKKRLWHWCFPANFVKFSRTPFSQSTSRRLLL